MSLVAAILSIAIGVILYLGGGTARTDAVSLLYLRPFAVLCVTFYLACIDPAYFRSIRLPMIFLVVFGIILALQLIALPPAYWRALPGHDIYAGLDGASAEWRPISISPDRTLNTLVSLVIPLAALLAAGYAASHKKYVLSAMISGGLVSGAVAMMQLALGDGNALYLYRLTTSGAVGLFSNPNHQAVMLACVMPMIALWLADSPKSDLRRDLAAASVVLLVLVLVMVTGSRSGLAASIVGLVCAFALHDACLPRRAAGMRRRYRIFYLSALGVIGVVAALTIALGRNLAVIRFSELNVASDLRVADFHLFIQLARDYFPFGSGGGTFDPAFRAIEPASIIKKTYVNHAHNELIETAITLGLPGLLMILAFLAWFVTSMINVLRVPRRQRDGYALLGGALIAITMLASLTDYLLRTPLMGAMFAVACAWLSMGSVAAKAAFQPRRSPADRTQTLSKFQEDLVP
jgi:O-antigen ligase